MKLALFAYSRGGCTMARRVLTARPTWEEEARVPHRLYGVRPAAEAASVAWWRGAALAEMAAARAAGRRASGQAPGNRRRPNCKHCSG